MYCTSVIALKTEDMIFQDSCTPKDQLWSVKKLCDVDWRYM